MQGTPITYYQYPDQNDPVVKLGKAVGKAFYNQEEYNKRFKKLYEHMQELTIPQLMQWRDTLLISPEWNGATGQGAYIAVASRVVNEVATEILKEHSKMWKEKHGDALFVVINPEPQSE